MPTTAECNFIIPDVPISLFDSVSEGVARLSITLRDEFVYTDSLMALLKKRPVYAFAFKLLSHTVRGIEAGFFFVWFELDMEIGLEEGEVFSIRLENATFITLPPPYIHMTIAEKRTKISNSIIEAVRIARDTASKDDKLFKAFIYTKLDAILRGGAGRDKFVTL